MSPGIFLDERQALIKMDTTMARGTAKSDGAESTLILAENLRQAAGKFVRGIRSQAGTPTTSQSETLAILDRDGPTSIADLAGRRNVRHQSMRLVVGQLERRGLISKTRNPTDARSQLLSLTEKGRHTLSQAREARTREIAALIDTRLSEQERRTLRDAITIIERLV